MMDHVRSNMRFFFETFMPGVFLLCNGILSAIMLLAALYEPSSEGVIAVLSPLSDAGVIAVALIVVVAFGYGLGTVLRLLKVSWVDRMAGEYLCHFTKERDHKYASEPFFYLDWIKEKLDPDSD